MHKAKLIPKLAIEGVRKNSSSYLPYIFITSFSVFVFFIFNAIYDNPMMQHLPHAQYLLSLMLMGSILLGLILIPILVSTNQFLIKQRKNELGLYNVLGLDQKYIGIMLFIETLILYIITVALGILTAQVFSRLIFLILLNLAGFNVECEFVTTKRSYIVTLIYFAVAFGINFIGSLWQVNKAKPIELMKSGRKGEKQERYLGLKASLGIIILVVGYSIAIRSKIDSWIFSNFFFAVFSVVLGTRLLFKAGTTLLLKKMKSIPKIYYHKHYFIMISDMLYRMKRNAHSLSNICIFSTMIMITLTCTLSLFVDEDRAIHFNYPMDVIYELEQDTFSEREEFDEKIKTLAQQYNVQIQDKITFNTQMLAVLKEGNRFVDNTERNWFLNNSYAMQLMTIQDYNQLAHTNIELNEDEVLIFSPTKDFNNETVYLNDTEYKVKEELKSLCFESKQPKNATKPNYYIILSSQKQIKDWAKVMNATKLGNRSYTVAFNLEGEQTQQDAYIKDLDEWVMQREGGVAANYVGDWEKQSKSMYGGLLFIGIFFGAIFGICLLMMMYYKQITEGYEDQRNFKILKQVGMSDEEVKRTIKRQILMIFFLPLVGAIIHTFVGLTMVSDLMETIRLYDTGLITRCSMVVMLVFAILYAGSYTLTSKAYYRIVR